MRTIARALAGVALLLAAACQKGDAVAVKTVVTAADSADQVMFNARSLITHDGAIRAELFADTALFFDENTRIEMRGVKTHFHNKEGDRNTVLTSRQGTYNTRISKMEARGDVDVVSRDGRRLQTVQLRYDQLGNQISGDSAFTLTQPGGRMLQGVGFVSDPDMRNVQVLRATQGYAGVITDKEPVRGAGTAPATGSAATGTTAAASSPAGAPPAAGAKPAKPAAPAKAPAGMFTLPKSRP
jgi:LPS export ABC transporter protein LptC